jgi:hypothetical protein
MEWEADSIQTKWSNRYGTLEVEPVGEVQAVSGIRGTDVDDDLKFDVDTAEKIVLITENRRCQIAVSSVRGNGSYLLVHTSCSMAAVVKIVSLEFTDGVVPQEAIAGAAGPVSLGGG